MNPLSNTFSNALITVRRVVVSFLAVVFMLPGIGGSEAATPAALEIRTISSRADMASGGDTLIEIKAPPSTPLNQITLTLNNKDVSSLLKNDSNGTFRALVGGLIVGDNTFNATIKSPKTSASLKVTNYPITGPIVSGPHLTPYECRTMESGMGQPLDEDCSAKQKIDFFYRASDNTFKPMTDPFGARPADLVTTTTYDGKTVPYIVRVESGTINRAIYRIGILDEPTPGTDRVWSPGAGWNRKLAVNFGGGAGTQYNQGANQVTAGLSHLYLSHGFAYMVSTELVNQQHANAVLQGETLMMMKEHFIKHYGVPKWTVGNGGSGGAIQQLLITEMYPGLLDGLQPSLSFPDSSLYTADCGLLQNFWRKADSAKWTNEKKAAVEGFTNGTCSAWERSFVPVLTATNVRGCAVSDPSKVYDPVKNPKGLRCTIQEMRINIYGRDPKTGFARKPEDNVGLQYGLQGLNSGVISVDEFLELNEKIGGNDVDGGFISERAVGDPIAIKALYESGLMNYGGGGLANVPILHYRTYNDAAGDIHDRHRDLTIRARLRRANGRYDNQVIWVGPPASRTSTTSANIVSLALDTMNTWLDKMAADPAPLSTDKVVRNKPAEAVDAYFDAGGKKLNEEATFDGKGGYNTMYPVHSEPRLVAGAPLTNDVAKCQLKPINYSDYKVQFTSEQKTRMAKIFSTGVCDFTKPGVNQVPFKTTYRRY